MKLTRFGAAAAAAIAVSLLVTGCSKSKSDGDSGPTSAPRLIGTWQNTRDRCLTLRFTKAGIYTFTKAHMEGFPDSWERKTVDETGNFTIDNRTLTLVQGDMKATVTMQFLSDDELAVLSITRGGKEPEPIKYYDGPVLEASAGTPKLKGTWQRVTEGGAEAAKESKAAKGTGKGSKGGTRSSNSKLAAFKDVIAAYEHSPGRDATMSKRDAWTEKIKDVQQKFFDTAFDPAADPTTAKTIVTLFEERLENRFDGYQYNLLDEDIRQMWRDSDGSK